MSLHSCQHTWKYIHTHGRRAAICSPEFPYQAQPQGGPGAARQGGSATSIELPGGAARAARRGQEAGGQEAMTKAPKMRHCWFCGDELGVIEDRHYQRGDTCGKPECEREARDQAQYERTE